jgi:hypothetical protein
VTDNPLFELEDPYPILDKAPNPNNKTAPGACSQTVGASSTLRAALRPARLPPARAPGSPSPGGSP